jgi:tryptophan-rich sensory protein
MIGLSSEGVLRNTAASAVITYSLAFCIRPGSHKIALLQPMRRGRRHKVDLRVGDYLDCWRVESLEPDRRLRLVAEMILPGRAWLEFEVEPTENGSLIRQTAVFDPIGLTGLAYWYGIYPLHEFVFNGMLNGIAKSAQSSSQMERTWNPSALQQVVWLIGFLIICFSAAGIGAAVTMTSVGTWYQTLLKPSWNPPDWIFGPVWTLLYLCMAISAWLVWRSEGWKSSRKPLHLFGIQLLFNVGWSVIFFGLHSPGFAFLEILILLMLIVATLLSFQTKSSFAALLLVPYLVWTSFAAVLNFTIYYLNS